MPTTPSSPDAIPSPMPNAPVHAVSVWLSDDALSVAMLTPKGHTQTISLPLTESGLAALSRLLRERAMAAASDTPQSFASPAIPIQHMIDAIKITTTVRVTERATPKRSGPARGFAAVSETELSILSDALDDIF